MIVALLPLPVDDELCPMTMALRMAARLMLERSFTCPAQVLKTVAVERVAGVPGVPTVFTIMAR